MNEKVSVLIKPKLVRRIKKHGSRNVHIQVQITKLIENRYITVDTCKLEHRAEALIKFLIFRHQN